MFEKPHKQALMSSTKIHMLERSEEGGMDNWGRMFFNMYFLDIRVSFRCWKERLSSGNQIHTDTTISKISPYH